MMTTRKILTALESAGNAEEKLFTIAEVQALLKMKPAAVKKHIYQIGDLVPSKRYGRTPLFTRQDIATFLRQRRAVGRPKTS